MLSFKNKLQAHEWAKALLEKPFYILDFETVDRPNFKTGYFPEPLSLAIISCNSLGYEVALNQLVKPLSSIAEGAKVVHGIDENMLADKPSFRDIYPDVVKALHKERVIAYNANFEMPVLDVACKTFNLPRIKPMFSCAMMAFSAFDGTPNEWGKPKWWKLSDACQKHGINPDGAHDALNDVVFTYKLIQVIAKG